MIISHMATASRHGVTPDVIADAAAAIADREGLSAVTLTRLAADLGVKPPSLYKHVDGLDAVLAMLTRRGLAEANARLQRATVGKSRDAALTALAHAYWDFARERPGLYAASLRPIANGDREAAVAAEALLGTLAAVLSGYAVTGDDARHAMRGFRAIIHGFVSLDATGAFRLRSDLAVSFDRLLAAFARSLGPP
jgi:AcrR family transcriptional regulator